LPDEDIKYFEAIEAAAKRVGVSCQRDWSLPPPTVSNIFIVAHYRCDLRDDLLKWEEQGFLRGRYLLLYVCGNKGESPLTPAQLNELKLVGSATYLHQILLVAVASHLEHLLSLP
jgi:hypothetical protein